MITFIYFFSTTLILIGNSSSCAKEKWAYFITFVLIIFNIYAPQIWNISLSFVILSFTEILYHKSTWTGLNSSNKFMLISSCIIGTVFLVVLVIYIICYVKQTVRGQNKTWKWRRINVRTITSTFYWLKTLIVIEWRFKSLVNEDLNCYVLELWILRERLNLLVGMFDCNYRPF